MSRVFFATYAFTLVRNKGRQETHCDPLPASDKRLCLLIHAYDVIE